MQCNLEKGSAIIMEPNTLMHTASLGLETSVGVYMAQFVCLDHSVLHHTNQI